VVVGVTRSSPGPSDVAAHVAAGPPAVDRGRGNLGRNPVGWCDHGPVGRERGACDLRQYGACEQDLLHAETLPHTTKLGASYYKAHPLLLQPGHSSAGFLTSFSHAADPQMFPGEPAREGRVETAVADWLRRPRRRPTGHS